MFAIDWRNLRTLNGSQNDAFEELCCQLAEYESPQSALFYRKGVPDAGVECFIKLIDQTEWAWQAKYFLSIGNSQWTQLDDSVKTALEKHPKLTKYTVCIPLDRADARIEGQKSLMERWDERVEKWKSLAKDAGMQVQFNYWGSYEILERLSREEHRGRFFFWFGKELFSQSWFQIKLQEAIAVAGPRYTPPIHVELPISQLFDGLARTHNFYIRIMHILRDMKKEYSLIRLSNSDPETAEIVNLLREHAQQLFTILRSVDKSLTNTIPWGDIVNQCTQTRQLAYECRSHLEKSRERIREIKKNKLTNSSPERESEEYSYALDHLSNFVRKLRTLEGFIESVEARLANLPALLLCGEAGQGKTHLFCDIASRRIANGLPTILLMGQRFTQLEPWTQILQQLSLPETATSEDLLGALQAIAQAQNAKALLMIDALNEGEGKKIWPSHLPAMLQRISRYPWISIAISVRSSYEHVIITEGLLGEKLVRVEHHGFAEHEYQATRTFFDYYQIEQPSVPLLVPEFQNPLFLKLLCKGLHEDNKTKIPVGSSGITAVFKLFVNAINKKLADEAYCGFNSRRPIVWQAIDQLTEVMAERQKDWLPLEEAEEIINQILPGRDYEKSLYRNLVSEGLLVENGRWFSQDEWIEVVQFTYEKFSDHLIAKRLLDKYLTQSSLEQVFLPNKPLSFLAENTWRHQGLIEALCIQLPERIGREMPEVAPMIADHYSVGRGFVESIIWRNPQAINDITKQYLNKYISQIPDANEWILNVLLSVAINPDHPYNADFLHARLMKDEMAERDAWWSIFLHQQFGAHGAVDRLIDWAWSPEDKSHVNDEALRLCGVTLAWFLTTSNRFLRDRATKALVNLFARRIFVLIKVMAQFLEVNDPYVSERLYAVAYGCALRSIDDKQINLLAQVIHDWVFQHDKPPVHILLRDYARNTIEYALYRGINLNIEVHKIRPPYKSEWLSSIPEKEEIEEYGRWWEGMPQEEWARVAIHSSVMDFGDFSRYIIGTNHGNSNWLSLRLEEPFWQTSKEKVAAFINSLTGEQQKAWRLYQAQVQTNKEKLKQVVDHFLEQLSTDDLASLIEYWNTRNEMSDIPQVALQFEGVIDQALLEEITTKQALAEQRFRQTLEPQQLSIFETHVLTDFEKSDFEEDPPRFDLSIAQRWITKQVFNFGWTVKRFGSFDRYLDRNNFRDSHKAERIGKKYQWIAYHEFLARLADNFQYREQYSNYLHNHQYEGSWQISLRDIDPSCILKLTDDSSKWEQTGFSWWFRTQEQDWDSISDDVEWMKYLDDLPSVQSLIEVIEPHDRSCWLALNGFYQWEQPTPPEEDKYEIKRRKVWYMLLAYLVRAQDCDAFYEWAIKQEFMGRWMPEGYDLYNVFLGEVYWSPAYTHQLAAAGYVIGWQGGDLDSRIPKPIMPLVVTYRQEDSGFDCSIDSGISISVPNQFVVQQMGLDWNGIEGKYFDKSGKLIAFDPSVSESGPRVLLIHKESFLSFLQKNGYSIVWTVLGEKQLIGGSHSRDDWKGRLELSGVFRMKNSQLEGQVTPKFRASNNQI